MKLQHIHENYEITGERKNVIAALRRRGFSVTKSQRHPALQPDYLVCDGPLRERDGCVPNLVGRICLSETLPLTQHLEIYGPSESFHRLRGFAENYRSKN
jgi:hypothetical protein